MLEHARRKILHVNVTSHPSSQWVVQQLRGVSEAAPYRSLILDHDAKFDDVEDCQVDSAPPCNRRGYDCNDPRPPCTTWRVIVFLLMLGGFGVMALSYLLMSIYMRRRNGIQPGSTGIVIMAVSVGSMAVGLYLLRQFGLDVRHGIARNVFWLALGLLWMILAVWTIRQRQASGAVLMDLGPAPLGKLQMGFAVLMLALAIAFAFYPESRTQAFSYATWSGWLVVMARGRFQVRERGMIHGTFLPWDRIIGCVMTAEDRVRLTLKKGLQRTIDIKLPTERRDGFLQLVNARLAAGRPSCG